jgi:hypothetical protein
MNRPCLPPSMGPRSGVPVYGAVLLRRHGLHVTAQRLAVLRAVTERPHSTTDDINKLVRADIGAISQQAVYGSGCPAPAAGSRQARGSRRAATPAGRRPRAPRRPGRGWARRAPARRRRSENSVRSSEAFGRRALEVYRSIQPNAVRLTLAPAEPTEAVPVVVPPAGPRSSFLLRDSARSPQPRCGQHHPQKTPASTLSSPPLREKNGTQQESEEWRSTL